jgi:hypothetical protein
MIEDEVVMQDIALREQVLDRRLLKLVREEQMALPSITQNSRHVAMTGASGKAYLVAELVGRQ